MVTSGRTGSGLATRLPNADPAVQYELVALRADLEREVRGLRAEIARLQKASADLQVRMMKESLAQTWWVGSMVLVLTAAFMLLGALVR